MAAIQGANSKDSRKTTLSKPVKAEHGRFEQAKHNSLSPKRSSTKRKRASLETRVSGKKQDEADKTSLALQLQDLQGRAQILNWEIIAENQSVVSGGDANADRLQRLRKEAKRNAWDLVAFSNADRAFRSVLVGLEFIEFMKGLEKEVWIGPVEATNATSDEKFLIQVLLAASELKRNKNGDASRGKRFKVQMFGAWYFSEIPLGYQPASFEEITAEIKAMEEVE